MMLMVKQIDHWILMVFCIHMTDMPLPCRNLTTALGGGASLAPDGKSIVLDLPPMGYAFVSFMR